MKPESKTVEKLKGQVQSLLTTLKLQNMLNQGLMTSRGMSEMPTDRSMEHHNSGNKVNNGLTIDSNTGR